MEIKLKSKAFKIDLGVYPCKVYVCFKDLDELRKLLKEEKVKKHQIDNLLKELDEDCGAITLPLQNGNSIIYFPSDFKNFPLFMGVISHESFHATDQILEHLEMMLVKGSEEAYAYPIGYIVEQIVKEL